MELSHKEAGHLPREALELNKQDVKIGNDSDAVLTKDIELNNTGAEKQTRAAAETYSSALISGVIVGLAIVLGAAVSFYVVRDVSTGIGSIIKPMQALGHGNLGTNVPHRGEKTEMVSMADALQVFKEALIAKKAVDDDVCLERFQASMPPDLTRWWIPVRVKKTRQKNPIERDDGTPERKRSHGRL